MLAGVAALGVSVVQGPFTWLNQACWAAYVGTVVLTVSWVGHVGALGHGGGHWGQLNACASVWAPWYQLLRS